MLNIDSNTVFVQKTSQEVFDFLVDLNNLEKLIPAEKIEYWKSTDTTCRFGIKNLSSIGMRHKELIAPDKIILESDGKNPFDFTLTVFILTEGEGINCYFEFSGDVNMFMKAMVQKPLKQFFDTLAGNLPAALN